MRLLVSIFLHGFLLDALLSVVEEWLPIPALRAVVAWAVFGLGLVLYVLVAFVPRLPKRLILPPFLFLVWTNICGGFPLAFVAPAQYQPALAWSQLIFAIALFLPHRRWRRIPPKLDAPAFSRPAFTILTILTVLAVPVVLAIAAINTAGVYLEAGSGGYVKLRPEGLLLEEREMTKDGKRVRLVSMVHIGEKSFYDHILASMPAQGAAVVLLEGVTDNQGLLKSRFSYSKIAGLLGLDSQETSSFSRDGKPGSPAASRPQVEYRRADVDISIFQPLTLEFMNALGVILSDPTAATILRAMQGPDSPFQQPHADEIVMRDILTKRNEHLVSEIDRALETSQTVIVPWGALHLPSIEASLQERGFQETGRMDRPLIHFWPQNPLPPAK
jgi:hypothetical protein